MKRFATLALWVAVLFSPWSLRSAELTEIDVQKFGAIADGQTVNTVAIQRAIDECNQRGGGVVRFSAGRYVSGTILLKDNVTLQLDQDATLLGSTRIEDYQKIDGFRSGN